MLRKVSRLVLVIFFIVAGINHFRDPEFYYPLIPAYLPYHGMINWLSGFLELISAVGLMFVKTRKYSSLIIVSMLIAFIPSHIHFIGIGSCIDGGLCVPPWVAWLRLVLIHPLLLIWVWWHRT